MDYTDSVLCWQSIIEINSCNSCNSWLFISSCPSKYLNYQIVNKS